MACLLSACKSTLQAGRVLLSKTESNKAYQQPVLHVKHIWSDFQNCFFLLIFHVHLLVSVGRGNITYLQLYRNAGAADVDTVCRGKSRYGSVAAEGQCWQHPRPSFWMDGWRRICREVLLCYREIKFPLWISLALDQGITYSVQISQKYCMDETFLAVFVLASLSHISVPE